MLFLAGHSKWVWDCVFSVDAAYLVTASSDCTARLWDLSSGDAIRVYSGHHKVWLTTRVVCLGPTVHSAPVGLSSSDAIRSYPGITRWAPSIDPALPTLVPCLSSFFGLQDCSDTICLRAGKAGVIGRHGDPNSSETQARSDGAQAVVACALNDSAIEGAPGGHSDGG